MSKSAKGEVSLRTRVLETESGKQLNCTMCVFHKTPWKRGKKDKPQSCSERNFSELCDEFKHKLLFPTCGECDLLKVCPTRTKPKKSMTACEEFSPLSDSELETDDPMKYSGLLVEGIKYADTPVTPVTIRIGDRGIMIEPENVGGVVKFKITPFVLDESNNFVFSTNSESPSLVPCGTPATITPKPLTYRDRIRLCDIDDGSQAYKILRAAVSMEDYNRLPKDLVLLYESLYKESAVISVSAKQAIHEFAKTHSVSNEQRGQYYVTLVKYASRGNNEV